MRISVVTAVYNRVDTVGSAIDSVQAQTYRDVEHVIQDGGSSDGTLDVVRGLANGSTKLVSERDHGIYDAINRGIGNATGDVIGLMHSDDLLAHAHVLEMVAQAFEDPLVSGVYGDLQYVAAHDLNKVVRHWRSGEFDPAKLRRGWMPPHPTVYLRRDIFEQYGLYDTSFTIAADYDAMLRYLSRDKVKLRYIPSVLVKMRLGGASNRSMGQILKKSREDYRAIRKNRVGGLSTLAAKNFSKIGQFFIKE